MAQVTVTGKTGPGLTMSAQVFQGIVTFSVNTASKKLTLVDGSDKVTDVDINAATTMTVTISNGTYTVSVS